MSLSTDHPFRRLAIGVVSFLAITVMTVGAARAEHKVTTPEQADIEGAIVNGGVKPGHVAEQKWATLVR